MTLAATRVYEAIAELERALGAYLAEEDKHGVPRDVSAESALGACSPWLVQTLLDHMPTLAHPWRVVDMRRGKPTKLVRDGYGEPIAMVRRVSCKPMERWSSRVGIAWVEDEIGANWPSCEAAQAACDAQLQRDGVTIVAPSCTAPAGEVKP